MGKTADSEKIRLRATYHNNCSVAFMVTGFAVPYFAIVQKLPQIVSFLAKAMGARVISITESEFGYVLSVVSVLGLALWSAKYHRRRADEEIQKLPD